MLRVKPPLRMNGREAGLYDPVDSPISATSAGNFRFIFMLLLLGNQCNFISYTLLGLI
jgi:hypothetical protein